MCGVCASILPTSAKYNCGCAEDGRSAHSYVPIQTEKVDGEIHPAQALGLQNKCTSDLFYFSKASEFDCALIFEVITNSIFYLSMARTYVYIYIYTHVNTHVYANIIRMYIHMIYYITLCHVSIYHNLQYNIILYIGIYIYIYAYIHIRPLFSPILAIPSTPSCDQRCFALGLDETHHATQKDHGSKPWSGRSLAQ